SQQPFVEQEGPALDVLYLMEKQPLVFPCRVTHPNLTASLVKGQDAGSAPLAPGPEPFPKSDSPLLVVSSGCQLPPTDVLTSCSSSVPFDPGGWRTLAQALALALVLALALSLVLVLVQALVLNGDYSLDPDQRQIIWNSKRGFTIKSPTFFYISVFFCQTRVNNVTYKSRSYLVHRPVNNIRDVKLNVSEPVKALKGQRLVLNCTAIADLNSRANISWDYPGKNNPTSSTYKRLFKHPTHILFYNVLTIPKLQRSDRGLYKCSVSSGDKFKQRNISVTVLKDGMLAAEQCSRYRMDGNSLVIRDVAEEDAGKYTVLARIKEHGLTRNLTLTLVVN
ncbi:unnamed protein product, partial [Tetraodon nigroviridis]